MKRLPMSVPTALSVALASSVALAQGEWTRFRGPDGTGIGKAQGLPITFTVDDFAWQVKLPARGHSSHSMAKSCRINPDQRYAAGHIITNRCLSDGKELPHYAT